MALQQSVNLSEVSAGVAIIVSRDPLTDGQLMDGWKTLYSSILRGYFPDKGKINSTVPLMFTSLWTEVQLPIVKLISLVLCHIIWHNVHERKLHVCHLQIICEVLTVAFPILTKTKARYLKKEKEKLILSNLSSQIKWFNIKHWHRVKVPKVKQHCYKSTKGLPLTSKNVSKNITLHKMCIKLQKIINK